MASATHANYEGLLLELRKCASTVEGFFANVVYPDLIHSRDDSPEVVDLAKELTDLKSELLKYKSLKLSPQDAESIAVAADVPHTSEHALASLRYDEKISNYSTSVVKSFAAHMRDFFPGLAAHTPANNLSEKRHISVEDALSAILGRLPTNAPTAKVVRIRGSGIYADNAVAVVFTVGTVLRARFALQPRDVSLSEPIVFSSATVCAYAEERNDMSDCEWPRSKHAVFRRISDHFNSVLQRTSKGSADGSVHARGHLREIVYLVASYADLFSAPCVACRSLLVADRECGLLPPIVRGADGAMGPLHPDCRWR